MTPEEFKAQFNSRTAAYLANAVSDIDSRPVLVRIGPGAHNVAGHALAYGLANLLARAHRGIGFLGDLDRPLLCPSMFGEVTLRDATEGLSRAINPHIDLVEAEGADDPLIVVGLASAGDVVVGCDGWCARFGEESAIVDRPASTWGACLAACYTATACVHTMLGKPLALAPSYSLWDYGRASDIQGPDALPINVGKVLQVGAGAVGSALDFWLRLVGLEGEWMIADQDEVDASNLNRQLAFTAADAGYPTGAPVNKAVAVAERLAVATPSPRWYRSDEDAAARDYDLVLALANEYGARDLLQERQPPVLLHATTSTDWLAQLHRHVAGHDDCIGCRLPGGTPQLRCSTGEIGEAKAVDASLPFLSGAAGLLLASELVRLAGGGYPAEAPNCTSLYMGIEAPITVQRVHRACRDDCDRWMSPGQIEMINAGNRFLDAVGRESA